MRPSGCCAASRCPCWCPTTRTTRCPVGRTITTWPRSWSTSGCPSGSRRDPGVASAGGLLLADCLEVKPESQFKRGLAARRAGPAGGARLRRRRRPSSDAVIRAVTRAGQIKDRRPAREGRPPPGRRPALATCSAGPTRARSTRCWRQSTRLTAAGSMRWPPRSANDQQRRMRLDEPAARAERLAEYRDAGRARLAPRRSADDRRGAARPGRHPRVVEPARRP